MNPAILAHRLRKHGYPIVARCDHGYRVQGVYGVLSLFALARLARGLEAKR